MLQQTDKHVTLTELGNLTRSLSPLELERLRGALNATIDGQTVVVSFLYKNQTKAKRRVPGLDYQALPGVDYDAMFGTIHGVFRYVNNAANRRKGRVGQVYFGLNTQTRLDLEGRAQPTSFRPAGMRFFTWLNGPR